MATDREKILQTAQKYVDKKRYDKAIEEYQKIIKQDPKDARTLLKIGDLQARLQAYGDAIATYDKVGQHYASQGFALKAIAVYKQVRELINKHAPDLAERYAHIVPRLAEIYTQLGLTGDALATYDEVATRHLKNGRDREAIEVFSKMVELDPANPLSRVRLAEACCRAHEVDRAVDSFWTAAELLLKLNRREDALKVIERILHFRQDVKYARFAAELYLQRRTREDALQALAKLNVCFQANPKDLDTLALLAQAFDLVNAPAKAIEVQKEIARVARDQGRQDLFEQMVAHLRAVAPDDDGVRQLLTMPLGSESLSSSEAQQQYSQNTASLHDAELEIIEDDAVASVASHELEPELPGPRQPPFGSQSPNVVVVGEAPPYAEEVPQEAPAFDAQEHARKAVADAESFRRLRLYSKAIEVLHIALEIDPGALDVREKLFEILQEAGDSGGATNEAITLAAIHIDRGDAQRAAGRLYDALRLTPDNPTALHMLAQVGAEPPRVWGNPETGRPAGSPAGYPADSPGRYADGPLPSYDLEEVSAGDLVGTMSFDGVDDPFGDLPDAPLPSFPLGEAEAAQNPLPSFDDPFSAGADSLPGYGYAQPSSQYEQDARAAQQPYPADPSYPHGYAPAYPAPPEGTGEYAPTEGVPEYTYPVEAGYPDGADPRAYADAYGQNYAQSGYAEQYASYDPSLYQQDYVDPQAVEGYYEAPAPEGNAEAIEAALEEAEFFAARGLYDDAKAILFDQLSRTPNHPLLLERLSEVDSLSAKPGESGTIERSQLQAPASSDRVFDIAASLEALDALEGQPGPVRQQFASQHDEIDVEQVFAKFKEGVRKQVADGDAATHYDLGVAYKEMGLLPDAIGEFELAARDPARECMCFAMIGLIHLEQNAIDAAELAYKRGLEAVQKTVEQEMSLYYDLGNVMEMKQETEEALYYFKKIARRDPMFRDVKDRIAALEPHAGPTRAARAAGDEDEFDRVFDGLFSEGAQVADGKRRR